MRVDASSAARQRANGSVQSVHVFRHALILTAICLLTFFAGLGRSAIGDSDEAFYAESAREMIEHGDWITPHYNYEYRFQKPVLFYWLVALSYVVAGIGEAAARFPSALAGLGITLLTAACGRRWIDARTGLLAGAMVATSYGYFTIARSSLPDLPLAFFITLATWAWLEAMNGSDQPDVSGPGSRTRLGWLVLGSAATAFGVLTKGPVGLAVPALIVLVVRAITRRPLLPSRDGWLGVSWTSLLIGALVLLAIALPWYGAMVSTHGTAYLGRFFVGENLERFATDRYNDPRPFWFYVPILLGGLTPWTPLLVLGIPAVLEFLRRERRFTAIEWRLLLWASVPFVFYTLSIGKQPRYILPVLPPLAVLAARTMLRRIDRATADQRRHVPLVIAASLSAVMLLVLAVLLYRARPLLFALSPLAGLVGTATIVVAGLGLGVMAWFGRHAHLPAAIAAAATATLLSLHYSVYSAAGDEPVQRMATLFSAARQQGEPSGTYRAFVRNLVFYTGVKQDDLVDEAEAAEFLSRPERVLCVMPLDLLEPLERNHGLRVRRLGEVLYFNPSGVRLRTLLSPAEGDLERVVLVTNR
jgi:4-amino-4-deoxy-L-arabinose transferase-like glycosyltransferase